MHEDSTNYTTGNPTISVGTILSIKAVPNPQYSSWPRNNPTWTIEEKPSGSSVTAPPDGRSTYHFTFDKKGTYKIKASCGASSAEIRIVVKELAVNLISIYPGQGQEEILSDLLEDQFYWGRASLTGGASSDSGSVIWSIRKADGGVEEHTLLISFEDQILNKYFVTDRVDNVSSGTAAWNYSSSVKAEIDDSGSIIDWDSKNTTVHREWEVDEGTAWENVGWDPQNWQHFDTCQSGDSLTQSSSVEEKWSVSYSLTTSASIGAGAEGALKAQLGFTGTFNRGYEITFGSGETRTVTIPKQPSNKYWGVFWIREIEKKTCNAYKWDEYGNKTNDGTVELNRKQLRLGRSHEPADSFTEAGSHFPRL